jgi:hypothetical protein
MTSLSPRPARSLAERLAPGAISPAAIVVGLLLCTDLLMIGLHLAHRSVQVRDRLPVVRSTAFNISHDLGLAESFGYVQLFWIVLLLGWLALLGHRRSYLPWSFLYGCLLVDDMFALHERFGASLVPDPDRVLVAGLRAQDAGELAVAAVLALVAGAPLVWGYRRGTARTRTTYRWLFGATVLLAAFGLAVDAVATALGSHRGLQVMHLVEDGGELLVVSAVLGYVLVLADRARRAAPGPLA